MKISTRGRYSLEALLYLGLLPDMTFASTRVVAEATGISDGYLEQLFIPLKKAGLIEGLRGATGGYRIGRPAGEILVGDILRAVEGPLEPVACLGVHPCSAAKGCIARNLWSILYREISNFIDSVTLEDLVSAYSEMLKDEGGL